MGMVGPALPLGTDAAGLLASLVIFILPSYFANAVPVLLGGGAPIDGKKRMGDGRRLFGGGKTVRGFFAGIFAAVLAGALQALMLPGTQFDIYPQSPLSYVVAGFLLGLGTMAGDLLGSFIKRRQSIPQGKPSFLLDQLSFLFGALLFSYPFAQRLIGWEAVLFLSVLTYFVHVAANVAAHRFGLKKVPW